MKDTLNKNWKPTQKTVKSGDWIVSEWQKWLFQRKGISNLSGNEIALLIYILESSFRYGNRYCYLSYDEMPFNKRTSIRLIKSLQEKGLLQKETSYLQQGGSKVKGKNRYSLFIPNELKNKFKFYGNKEQTKEKQEIDISNIEI